MSLLGLTAECFGGNGTAFDEPTWQDVEHFLGKLDGETWWMLCLEHENSLLTLEGGVDNHLVVGWSDAGGSEHYVAVRNDAEDEVLTIGGQTSEAEARLCTTRVNAIAIARVFFADGARATDVAWERPE